jgi:hypothetical protein
MNNLTCPFEDIHSENWNRLREVLKQSPAPIDKSRMFFCEVETLRGPCIYILVRRRAKWERREAADERKFYIGQTDNILIRLGQHIRSGKRFDYVLVIPMERIEDLNSIEPWLIQNFNPNQQRQKFTRVRRKNFED